jgi:hypothetical protein
MMQDPRLVGSIAKPRQTPTQPWSAYEPLRTDKRTGNQVFASPEHDKAYRSTRPEVARYGRGLRAVGMLGQTPLLARSVLEAMAIPEEEYGLTKEGTVGFDPSSKKDQISKALAHMGLNFGQDLLTRDPYANALIDFIYQQNFPQIDKALENTMFPKSRTSMASFDPKLSPYGIPGTPPNPLVDFLSSKEASNFVRPFVNAQLPKQLKGYRGHTQAAAMGRGGKPNYGTNLLDLITDITNPGLKIAPYLSEIVAPISAEFSRRAGRPMYYTEQDGKTPLRDSKGQPKMMSFASGAQDAWKYLRPQITRDLKASVTGFGRNMENSFIP